MSASLPSSDVRFCQHGKGASGGGEGGRGADPRLVPERDLGIGEAGGVALALLHRDPCEDAVEPLVVDDLAGSQARLVFRIELRGEDAPFARIVRVPSSASLRSAVAPQSRRFSTESSST